MQFRLFAVFVVRTEFIGKSDINTDCPLEQTVVRNPRGSPALIARSISGPLQLLCRVAGGPVFSSPIRSPSPYVYIHRRPCRIQVSNPILQWRLKNKNQLDATYYFTVLLIGSTCFGHYYAHHQELATMMLITTLVVSFLVCCRLEVRHC